MWDFISSNAVKCGEVQFRGGCKLQKRMAPQVGLEPTTLRLTAGCSAIELLRSDGAPARLKLYWLL